MLKMPVEKACCSKAYLTSNSNIENFVKEAVLIFMLATTGIL